MSYDEHLGPVNTLTFVDDNKKFVSTSDDKKVFLWEFNVAYVFKHISDPEMQAVSRTVVHPSHNYMLGQCSDNKVMVYDVKGGNIKLNKRK